MMPAIGYAVSIPGELPPDDPLITAREIRFDARAIRRPGPQRLRSATIGRMTLRAGELGAGMPAPVSRELLSLLCDRAAELGVDSVTLPLGGPATRAKRDGRSVANWRLPPLTESSLDGVCVNLETVQGQLQGREIYLETCACQSRPAGSMSEVVFLRRILERTSCGWSIDVAGIFANGMNFAFDPLVFVAQVLSAASRLQLRLSGGRWEAAEQRYAVAVREPISEELLRLMRQILRLAGERTTALVLDRDWSHSQAAEVRSEFQRVRRTVEETCGGFATRRPARRSTFDVAEWIGDGACSGAARSGTRN